MTQGADREPASGGENPDDRVGRRQTPQVEQRGGNGPCRSYTHSIHARFWSPNAIYRVWVPLPCLPRIAYNNGKLKRHYMIIGLLRQR